METFHDIREYERPKRLRTEQVDDLVYLDQADHSASAADFSLCACATIPATAADNVPFAANDVYLEDVD
jgi:hypothetical protein